MVIFSHSTAIGRITIGEENGAITNLYFESDDIPRNGEIRETAGISEAFRQLDAYFSGGVKVFSLPLAAGGTAFMRAVWEQLCRVPYGKTASYKEIARAVGNEKACRAVGMANNRNPLPIFIPCHRIIGADGKLTGYRGGLNVKKILLDLEQRSG